ncbi:MAG TPA: hypothetical protein VGY52_12610, partial [Roseiarcus sp.]|nr:hypothetical protein [Roseiarcus sp.]
HAASSPSSAFGASPLRFDPSGDCDEAARHVGRQEVLVTIPAMGRFAHQNVLTTKTQSTRGGVKAREATGVAGVALTPSTAMAVEHRRCGIVYFVRIT